MLVHIGPRVQSNPTPSQAYPDIAAQGQFFWIYSGGEHFRIGGTSAAAPTIGGIVSLINDARLARGLPTLGFLNPFIYAIGAIVPDAFNDIVGGSNPGCGTEGFTVGVRFKHVWKRAAHSWSHRLRLAGTLSLASARPTSASYLTLPLASGVTSLNSDDSAVSLCCLGLAVVSFTDLRS